MRALWIIDEDLLREEFNKKKFYLLMKELEIKAERSRTASTGWKTLLSQSY